MKRRGEKKKRHSKYHIAFSPLQEQRKKNEKGKREKYGKNQSLLTRKEYNKNERK